MTDELSLDRKRELVDILARRLSAAVYDEQLRLDEAALTFLMDGSKTSEERQGYARDVEEVQLLRRQIEERLAEE